MIAVWVMLSMVVLVFGIAVFLGPPYVRSHKQPVQKALDLLGVKSGDHLLDLGSGDGAVLLAAAKRGVRSTGYEINPLLWLISKWRTRKYREIVDIRWGDMWKASIDEETQNVYMFLDSRYPARLNSKLSDSGADLKLILYSFELPDRKPLRSSNGMNLYEYPKGSRRTARKII